MLIGAAVIAFCAVLGLHFWSRYGAYLKTLRDRDRLERKMIDDLLAQHAEIRAALAPYAESGRVALDVGMYGSIDFTDAKRVLDDILEPFSVKPSADGGWQEMLRHDPEVTSADTLPYVVVDRDTVGLPAQEAIKMTELKSALRDRGLSEKLFVTDAGPVIVVKGRKGEMLCLITESGFDVDEWADSIKAELS